MPRKKQEGLISARGKNVDLIAGGGGYGEWDEKWGQEIIEREIVPRVKPGDRVVDLAGGEGRVTMPFAMRKAKVIVVDLNPDRINDGDEIRSMAGARKAQRVVADIRTVDKKQLGGGARAVIASDALNHLPKEEADSVIDKLPRLLSRNRGGAVYVNAPATEGDMFQFPECFGAEKIGPRTLLVECECSGEPKLEPVPFYSRGEIEARLAKQGGIILATNQLERNGSGLLHEVVALFKPRKRK